jgi:hypothetical protein
LVSQADSASSILVTRSHCEARARWFESRAYFLDQFVERASGSSWVRLSGDVCPTPGSCARASSSRVSMCPSRCGSPGLSSAKPHVPSCPPGITLTRMRYGMRSCASRDCPTDGTTTQSGAAERWWRRIFEAYRSSSSSIRCWIHPETCMPSAAPTQDGDRAAPSVGNFVRHPVLWGMMEL